ncbi:MAG TPA: ABC transporter permease [Persephonella sp.]|uniref:ABC-type transport system involved in resistance to organic solvents, permease component n=1 Tax=Persephonella marina (strain DSM 14350 / EX-H1) TaxID=123214 RepID=C0QQX2_PERMH|nr:MULTISPECIES: ABC transporter permease [Persephonella]ACO03722.1 ABC-type transport system involved in resistance to organic solvents, permease component [Persephonella marina EX-H1]HCB68818.1 ABC transporter permease [Persephonella sp.]
MEKIKNFVEHTGAAFLLFLETLKVIILSPPKVKHILKYMEEIGVTAAPLIAITGFFTGGVLVVETYPTFHKFNAEFLIGALVSLSLSRELSPVLVALLVTARSGSAMAANIGTMKITEQIDALKVMAVNPVRYLIAPRLIASLLMVPALVILSYTFGLLGGYFVGVNLYGINPYLFVEKMKDFTELYDILGGLYKSMGFATIITIVSCYFGYVTKGGAEGVGRSTTTAVVVSSVLVLIVDYFLTAIIY